jgi:hypothetical protein
MLVDQINDCKIHYIKFYFFATTLHNFFSNPSKASCQFVFSQFQRSGAPVRADIRAFALTQTFQKRLRAGFVQRIVGFYCAVTGGAGDGFQRIA